MTSYQPSEYEAKLFQTAVDRALRISDLESALAAMTKERDALTLKVCGLENQLSDAIKVGAKLSTERDGLRQQVSDMTQEILDSHHKVAAAEAKLEAVGLVAFDIETGRLKQDLAIHRRLIKALAATGPSLRARVEKVVAQWVDKEKMLSAVMDGWLRVNPQLTCQSMRADLEHVLKGEACPK